MLRSAVAGIAGLGLIGGVGTVVYDDSGSATVKVNDNGVTRSVTLGSDANGPRYSCPEGIEEKLSPIDETSGRIQLTVEDVKAELAALDAKYPGQSAPAPVVKRYNALVDQGKELTKAFNNSVDQHNAVLEAECTVEE